VPVPSVPLLNIPFSSHAKFACPLVKFATKVRIAVLLVRVTEVHAARNLSVPYEPVVGFKFVCVAAKTVLSSPTPRYAFAWLYGVEPSEIDNPARIANPPFVNAIFLYLFYFKFVFVVVFKDLSFTCCTIHTASPI
jgi:hypothetical protein